MTDTDARTAMAPAALGIELGVTAKEKTVLRALKSSRCMFEQVEPRMLLATAHFVSAVTDNTSLAVVIDYAGVDPATLGTGDITFTTAGRPTVAATFASAIQNLPNSIFRVTYGLNAYDGGWGATDTGTYTISTPAGAVKDTQGANLTFTDIASLWMWFGTPKAKLISQTVTGSALLVVMQYDGLTPINESTIDGGDLVLGGGTASSNTVSQIIHLSDNSIQVVYSIGAPHNIWDFNSTGTYTVSLANNQVADNSGNQSPGRLLASYYLWFNSPTAEFQSFVVNNTSWVATVKFTAAPGETINPASLVGVGGLNASGPEGYFETSQNLTLVHNVDNSYTGTFSFASNGGSWDWLDSGTYTVSAAAGVIRDVSGNFLGAGVLGQATITSTAPAARMQFPTNPTSTGWDIIVDFTDNTAIDQSSINATSLRIEGPEGAQLPLTVQSIAFQFPNITRAIFHVSQPQGFINGAYTVFAQDQAARDTDGNGVAEYAMASFWLWF